MIHKFVIFLSSPHNFPDVVKFCVKKLSTGAHLIMKSYFLFIKIKNMSVVFGLPYNGHWLLIV